MNKVYQQNGKPTRFLRRTLTKRQQGKCADCGIDEWKLGLTRIRINQIEQGKTQTIKPENIQKIAAALGKPELYFYLGITHTLDTLPESVKGVMSKLAILPLPQQEKLGRIMAEILKWYEKEIGVGGSGR